MWPVGENTDLRPGAQERESSTFAKGKIAMEWLVQTGKLYPRNLCIIQILQRDKSQCFGGTERSL